MASYLDIKVITPKSFSDPNYAELEYHLMWRGRKGGVCQWLFLDHKLNTDVDIVPINKKSSTLMRNQVNSESREVELQENDLSFSDVTGLMSIMQARTVIRCYTDGTRELVGINKATYDYVASERRYNFKLKIQLQQRRVVK